MIADLHFLRPWWLLALLPAAFVWWRLWRGQDARAGWKAMITPHLLEALLVGRERRPRLRPVHLLAVLWGLAVAALAGPSFSRESSPFADDTAGMFVLLEVSPTMEAEDVPPSRLARAKQKLGDLLASRPDGATGLIAYAGTAHLVMPPTRDGRILEIMAEGLEPTTMPVEGDALARALARAAESFKRSGRAGSVVVLTDGVSPGQMPALEEMADSYPHPVLFLAMSSQPDLEAAARVLSASVVRLTADDADVAKIARRAERDVRASAEQMGERWRDSGYALLPLIALVALFWGRRGWVLG